MTNNSDKAVPAKEKSPWFRIGQFLFLVGLAVAVFLLAQSMVLTVSFEAAGSTRTAPSDHSRLCKSPDRGLE
jgi:cytochrome c-type biogenesis protein CcmH/NrfG